MAEFGVENQITIQIESVYIDVIYNIKFKQQKMGQKQTKQSAQRSHFDITEWIQQPSTQQYNLQYGNTTTFKHHQHNKYIDRYQQTLSSKKDYQNYLQSYQWRLQAYHLQTIQSPKYCSTTYTINIYIQQPKNRLSDFSDIPFPDTMYCLKSMLEGFQLLFQYVGSFPIREEQVCIDDRGNVKVWLNKDLSKNYPDQWELEYRQGTVEEEEEAMVTSIVKMVAKNSDADLQPNPTFQQFYEKYRLKNSVTFKDTIDLVEQYAQLHKEQVPLFFKAVVQVYQNQEGLYQQPSQQQNDNNYGEYTQRDISNNRHRDSQLRNSRSIRQQGLQENSHRSRMTTRSHKSRESQSSRINNLDRYRNIGYVGQQDKSNSNILEQENQANDKNRAQTYRLSSLSQLEENQGPPRKGQNANVQQMITYQPLQSYNPIHQNTETNNENIYRISSKSNMHNTSSLSKDGWVSLKPQQKYIPSSNSYAGYGADDDIAHLNNAQHLSHTGSSNSIHNQNAYNGDRNNAGGILNINDGTLTHFTNTNQGNMNTGRSLGLHPEQNQFQFNPNSSISERPEENNASSGNIEDGSQFQKQLEEYSNGKIEGNAVISRSSHHRNNNPYLYKNKGQQITQMQYQPQPEYQPQSQYQPQYQPPPQYHPHPPPTHYTPPIAYKPQSQFSEHRPKQMDQNSVGTNRTGSKYQLNQISNNHNLSQHANTGHFIPISNSSYLKSSQHQSSNSNLHAIEKNPSGSGFTIVVKSPSQHKIGYLLPNSQIRMVKNNSQPYFSAVPAYPVPQVNHPFLPGHSIPMRGSGIQNSVSSMMPISPRSQSTVMQPVQPLILNNFIPMQNNQVPAAAVNSSSSKVQENLHNSAAVVGESQQKINNSSNDIKIDTGRMSASQVSEKQKRDRELLRKEIETAYCTVNQEVPLDPQIVNDMLLYA